jgi:hypothetical protein
MFSRKLSRFVVAGAAAVAVAVGGFAIGNSSSGNGASATANAAPAAGPRYAPGGPGHAPGAAPGGPRHAPGAPSQAPRSGQVPQNWRPGTGTIITGAAADKAKAAALAAKYAGTVNRVLKLSDGSYVVHLIATSGPHHVFVSKAFKVTGAV